MNFKRGTLLQCSKCGHINEVIVELKISERHPYENPLDELESIESDIKRRTEEEKVCDEDCANCPVRYECPDSPYEHSIENTEKRIEP